MNKLTLSYPENGDRLKTILQLSKSGDRHHEVGSAFLPAGCNMPDTGTSAHPRHEVSIILEGEIETTSNGEMVVLQAGDIVSIPEHEHSSTKVLKDTRLIYIFFNE